ncbi:hypothetical protein MGYG_05731 [Nannizzia gypsea CBS 118893]|uniref:Protein kinase domain-containing protein n=1 Tax=Arthroderma gypseum (strain ATCC MYA-4604 / CBS 118893) TaxID=535722 RepID=E4UXJ8_ARTGP|nr:hypothetical protein MGYG_05731 [Nannizzia gypsea CBS 118893]EFR02732.1 hypothetical protein MGYG_05731 [Nannizzia gypsea CBS 118893]
METSMEELERRLKEAEARAEEAEDRAEEEARFRREAERLRREAEDRADGEERFRQTLEGKINPATFESFIQSCHELFAVPLSIQPKHKSTKGSITSPAGRCCPTTLRKWADFPRLRDELFEKVLSLFHPSDSPPAGAFLSSEGVKAVGNLVSRRSLGSELDFMSYERFAVEEHISSILQELLKLDTKTKLPFLGSGVSFENHANTLSDTPEPRQQTDGEAETLLYIIEYKASHKLRPANLKEDVVQAHEIPIDEEEKAIYNLRQLSGAAITQTFDYMIREGVEYGYLTTGEAFVFLHIKEDDPSTLYYHFSEPVEDVKVKNGKTFPYSYTAISSVLALCLLALDSEVRDQRWRSLAISQLHTWAVDIEYLLEKMPPEERRRTLSASSYIPSSPLSSPIQEDQSRPSRRLRHSCADPDDTVNNPLSDSSEEDEDDPSNRTSHVPPGKDFAVVIPAPRPPPSKWQQQSQEERKRKREPDRRYYQSCPNVALHQQMSHDGTHPISKAKVAILLDSQLNDDPDNGCWPLMKLHGARGILFKMTLAHYGYTFVGKGTIKGLVSYLQHEAKAYDALSTLQGSLIPVCLGSVNLNEPYITTGLDYIVHYLLLSWAGDDLDSIPGRDVDFYREARKLQKELGRYGVVHGDIRPANITWNSELSRAMLIDFDQARLKRKRPAIHSHSVKRALRNIVH